MVTPFLLGLTESRSMDLLSLYSSNPKETFNHTFVIIGCLITFFMWSLGLQVRRKSTTLCSTTSLFFRLVISLSRLKLWTRTVNAHGHTQSFGRVLSRQYTPIIMKEENQILPLFNVIFSYRELKQ